VDGGQRTGGRAPWRMARDPQRDIDRQRADIFRRLSLLRDPRPVFCCPRAIESSGDPWDPDRLNLQQIQEVSGPRPAKIGPRVSQPTSQSKFFANGTIKKLTIWDLFV